MGSEKYHVDWDAAPWFLEKASDRDLEKWATDPNCHEMEACAKALAKRLAEREKTKVAGLPEAVVKRKELRDNPFDPRTEVSADAKYISRRIVTHLWILFVLLPFIIGLLLAIVGVIR